MVYISHVRKSEDKVRQSYVIETTWMCKVEEYNSLQNHYRKQGLHNASENIGRKNETKLCNAMYMNVDSRKKLHRSHNHYRNDGWHNATDKMLRKTETKLCISKEMNVESRKEKNTYLTETLKKAGFT